MQMSHSLTRRRRTSKLTGSELERANYLSFPNKHALAEVRLGSKSSLSVHGSLHGQSFSRALLEVLPNSRRAGIFQISAMGNLEKGFQAPLTRPGIKLDEKMSVFSWLPKIRRETRGWGGRKKSHTWFESTLWRCLTEELACPIKTKNNDWKS